MDKREYIRYQLDCVLQIEGKGKSGQPFVDEGRLLNISGGGAQFETSSEQVYYKDQELVTQLILPETRDVKGRMQTIARVMRVEVGSWVENKDEKVRARVSVFFENHLELIRLAASQSYQKIS